MERERGRDEMKWAIKQELVEFSTHDATKKVMMKAKDGGLRGLLWICKEF